MKFLKGLLFVACFTGLSPLVLMEIVIRLAIILVTTILGETKHQDIYMFGVIEKLEVKLDQDTL